jgi:uncharacterized repeat protein (TIGR01451 family)
LLLLAQAAQARNFAARYTINTNGGLTLIGNSQMTCNSGTAGCSTAQTGSGSASNNAWPSVNIDVDSDATTFNSTTSDLSIPAGSTVLFAGLYWGSIEPATPCAACSQVLLKTPTSFGYTVVNASVFDTALNGVLVGYQAYADVTSLVSAGGSGTYTLANLQQEVGATANGDQSGWTLVVVYGNSSLPLRNLTVFDGFIFVAGGTTVNIPVSGFLTPLSGPVTTRLGVVTYDGDLGTAGDTFSLNGTNLSDAANPANNFYNSTVSEFGNNVTTRNPSYVDTLGFDLDHINVPSGILGNGATSATVTSVSPSGSEQYWLGVITFDTDLYVPIVTPNLTKTATDVNGGQLVAGDILRWTISMSNTGLDTATNLTLTDPIPSTVTYSPGSLVVTSGANAGTKTDASGDDQAEYISSGTPRVVFRLGTGANSTTGGNLVYTASTALTFDTTVNSGLAAGTPIDNTATISYNGQTIGTTFAGAAAAATSSVEGPATITKSFSPNPIAAGAASMMTIVLANPASNPATVTGVTFTDTYPSGMTNAASPNPSVTCTPGSSAGTITGAAANGTTIGMSPGASIAVGGNCTITVSVTGSTTGNYTNTTGAVASSNGGSGTTASATLSIGRPGITKAFSPTTILANATSTVTFTITNNSAVALSGMNFSDPLTTMVVAGTPAISNTCGGTVTAVAASSSISLASGTLAASSTCTISVNVTSSSGGILSNTATGVASTQSGAAGTPSNTAQLTVIAPPTIVKTFAHASEQSGVPSPMTIVVSNPNTTTTITGAAFTDTYPAGLINSTPANVTLNCSSGSTATLAGGASGGSTVGISAGSLLPGGSCTINIDVQGSTTGSKVNSTGTVTTTNAGTGAASSATLLIPTLVVPTVTKTYGATSITSGGNTTQTISFTNTNTTAITGVAFTDNYPLNLYNYSTLGLSNTCGGTVTTVAGGSSLVLSGGTIPAKVGATNGTCAISVNITSSVSDDYTNSTGTITTTNGGSLSAATGTLSVLQPPQIAKSFAPDTIATSTGATTSTLTLTLSNPTNASVSLTGVAVTDTFPTNLVVGTTPTATNGCGGTFTNTANGTIAAGNTGVKVTGVTLAPNAICTVSVHVSSNTASSYTNTTGTISSTNGGTGTTASATLAVARPDINKAFGANPIVAGATSVLTITLVNPTGAALTAAAFTDTYPSGMTNTASPSGATTCGGTVTAAANGGSVALSGGTIPANSSCTVTVNTTTTTTVTNTIAVGALSTSGGSNGNSTSATLQAYVAPTVAKAFSPSTILPGATSVLTITLTNTNSVAATTVAFTDTYPSNLKNTATPSPVSNCGGTVTGAANGTSLTLTGATIPANSLCTITVNVTSSTAGAYLNSTGSVTTANIGTGSAASATLTVMAAPTVTKTFSPSTQTVSTVSVLNITLTNSNSVAITGAAFTDTYPSGLVNSSSPGATSSCSGGTLTATASGSSVSLSGATIPANSSCVVSVNVLSASAGSYVNSTGSVTTTNAGTGTAASATLTVTVLQPALSVLKLSSTYSDPVNSTTFPKAIPGAVMAYTITITNTGPGTVDSNTAIISDPVPTNTMLYVGDIGAVGSGPIVFANGSTSSGLTYTYTSLASTTDNVEFSKDSGATWTYTPVPDVAGFDTLVTNVRIKPQGVMAAAGGTNPSFSVTFRVKIK